MCAYREQLLSRHLDHLLTSFYDLLFLSSPPPRNYAIRVTLSSAPYTWPTSARSSSSRETTKKKESLRRKCLERRGRKTQRDKGRKCGRKDERAYTTRVSGAPACYIAVSGTDGRTEKVAPLLLYGTLPRARRKRAACALSERRSIDREREKSPAPIWLCSCDRTKKWILASLRGVWLAVDTKFCCVVPWRWSWFSSCYTVIR